MGTSLRNRQFSAPCVAASNIYGRYHDCPVLGVKFKAPLKAKISSNKALSNELLSVQRYMTILT